VILIDTHIWLWWANDSPQLTTRHKRSLLQNVSSGIGVSVFSCWEVSMLDKKGKLTLTKPIQDWTREALTLPGVQIIGFTPEIAIESNRLPGTFHRDPADQILVATARVQNFPLLTEDAKILAYSHVPLAL
jgi:PIN domain nuclease of toxin-antitoxin system